MSIRTKLIEKLTRIINERENAELTVEQVEHYIGSDMSNEKLLVWVDETESGDDPVTSDDVLSLWVDIEPVDNRDELIEKLVTAINKSTKSLTDGLAVTLTQVETFVGSDATDEQIQVWIDGTETLSDPVTAKEVISLWENTVQ